jgi:hypothetical protein
LDGATNEVLCFERKRKKMKKKIKKKMKKKMKKMKMKKKKELKIYKGLSMYPCNFKHLNS